LGCSFILRQGLAKLPWEVGPNILPGLYHHTWLMLFFLRKKTFRNIFLNSSKIISGKVDGIRLIRPFLSTSSQRR
jgi:hypothetical protein